MLNGEENNVVLKSTGLPLESSYYQKCQFYFSRFAKLKKYQK